MAPIIEVNNPPAVYPTKVFSIVPHDILVVVEVSYGSSIDMVEVLFVIEIKTRMPCLVVKPDQVVVRKRKLLAHAHMIGVP